jgi:hypothetical protein
MSLMIGMVSVGFLFDRLHYVKYNGNIEQKYMEEVRGHAIRIIVLLVEFGVWTTLSHSSIKLISRGSSTALRRDLKLQSSICCK